MLVIASYAVVCFNPRARMGRDPSRSKRNSTASSFNPRARMGRDLRLRPLRLALAVSTHAPAWGATNVPPHLSAEAMFQPTRPHGARHALKISLSKTPKFQPTRPHGARLGDKKSAATSNNVSTHAPAWGATQNLITKSLDSISFNPRARMGRDLIQHQIH